MEKCFKKVSSVLIIIAGDADSLKFNNERMQRV